MRKIEASYIHVGTNVVVEKGCHANPFPNLLKPYTCLVLNAFICNKCIPLIICRCCFGCCPCFSNFCYRLLLKEVPVYTLIKC